MRACSRAEDTVAPCPPLCEQAPLFAHAQSRRPPTRRSAFRLSWLRTKRSPRVLLSQCLVVLGVRDRQLLTNTVSKPFGTFCVKIHRKEHLLENDVWTL